MQGDAGAGKSTLTMVTINKFVYSFILLQMMLLECIYVGLFITQIMIEFEKFTMADVNECDMNKVEIYDLHTYDAPRRLLKKYCSTSAPTVMAQSNRVFIRFVVSNTSTGNFFKVLYTAFRDGKN